MQKRRKPSRDVYPKSFLDPNRIFEFVLLAFAWPGEEAAALKGEAANWRLRGLGEPAIGASSEEFQFNLRLPEFPKPVHQVLVPGEDAAGGPQLTIQNADGTQTMVPGKVATQEEMTEVIRRAKRGYTAQQSQEELHRIGVAVVTKALRNGLRL